MQVAIIAAVSENGVIGALNRIPWTLPNDLKSFKKLTVDHTVLMGRRTWESIPPKYRPLPQRRNLVLSRSDSYKAEGAEVFNSIVEVLRSGVDQGEETLFVIGGTELYQQCFKFATTLYITEVHAFVEGDTFFPEYDKNLFKEISRERFEADDKHDHDFSFVVRRRGPPSEE